MLGICQVDRPAIPAVCGLSKGTWREVVGEGGVQLEDPVNAKSGNEDQR